MYGGDNKPAAMGDWVETSGPEDLPFPPNIPHTVADRRNALPVRRLTERTRRRLVLQTRNLPLTRSAAMGTAVGMIEAGHPAAPALRSPKTPH